MLDKVILTSSYELGSYFADKKQALIASPDSLIGQLVNLSTNASTSTVYNEIAPRLVTPQGMPSSDVDLNSLMSTISNGTVGYNNTSSLHDNAIGQVIDTLEGLVTSHISLARNVVKPHVLEFMSEYIEYTDRNGKIDPAAAFNIIQKDLFEIFEDETFLEQFKYYDNKTAIKPKRWINLGNLSIDTNSLMSVGSTRLDKLLQEAVSHMGDNFVNDVFENYLGGGDSGLGNLNYDNLGQQNVYDTLYVSLVLYLMAQKLQSNIPSGLENVKLADYQDHMLSVRDFAGVLFNNAVKRIYYMVKNNTVVLKSDSYKKEIYVQGPVYRLFLEQGGTVEMLLGACASNNGVTSLTSLLESRDVLTRAWNSYCTFAIASNNNNRLDNTKQYLRTAFDISLTSIDPVEQEYKIKDPNYFTTAKKLAYAYIDNIRLSNLDNPSEMALVLMAGCRFYFTAGYQILSGIEDCTKANKELDVREAALVSAIYYITDYLIDQLTPVNA
jgi:hypothetical protein